jgi:exosortase
MSNSATTGSHLEGFRNEVGAVWRQLPNKYFFLCLLGAWLLIFHLLGNATLGYIRTPSLLEWMYRVYENKNTEDGYGLLIPFVVLILYWLKRKELLALPLRTWWPGLLLLAGAMALHVLAYLIQQPKLSIVAMIGGVWSLMALAWGPQFIWRSLFPFCFLVFMVPMSSLSWMQGFTFYLRLLSAKLSVFLAGTVLGVDVVRHGVDFVFNAQPPFRLSVAPACSGIHSLVALLALTTIFGVMNFERVWMRAAVAFLAVPLALLGNVLRLTIVIVVGSVSGQTAATSIEKNLGFLTFLVALGVLMLIVRFAGGARPGSSHNLKEVSP